MAAVDFMVENGFSEEEARVFLQQRPSEEQQLIDQEADRITPELMMRSGFSEAEVKKFFDVKGPTKEMIKSNLEKTAPKEEPREAESLTDFIEAGFDISVTGLLRGEAPDVFVPENASMWMGLASQTATFVGDIPAMMAGSVTGTAAGTAVGGPPGAVVGGFAGAFAAPATFRKILMDSYEKGEVVSFSDFWQRAGAAGLEFMKGATTGALTGFAGRFVAPFLKGAPSIVGKGAVTASEIATMTTVGSALEGELPEPKNFADAAIIILGMKGTIGLAGKIQTKLRDIYAKTGIKPEEVATKSQEDPALRQELLSAEDKIPESLEHLIEPDVAPPKQVEIKPEAINKPEFEGMADGTPERVIINREAEAAVLERIGEPKPAGVKRTMNNLYTEVVDSSTPIKEMVKIVREGKDISKADDPYVAARLANGSTGMAEHFVKFATFEHNGQANNGISLSEISRPIVKGNRFKEFQAFAIAARGIELEARGIKTGIPMEEAGVLFREGRAEFEKPFKELVEYSNRLLKYVKDSGLITDKQFKTILEANKNYVPLYRLMGDAKPGAKGVRGYNTRNPIKSIKGSLAKFEDPIESIIKNTHLYIRLAENNRVGSLMVQAAKGTQMGETLIKKSTAKQFKIKLTESELKKGMAEVGIEFEPGFGPADSFEIFRPQKKPLADNEIAVFEKGNRVVYETTPELARAVRNLDAHTINLFVKVLSVPAKALRAGVTLTPNFWFGNILLKDTLSALVFSKAGVSPLDMVNGFMSRAKIDGAYKNWLKGGGGQSSFISIDRRYMGHNLSTLSKETGFLNSSMNVVRSPIESARAFSELLNDSTRLPEFKNSMLKGENIREAAFTSREVAPDVGRRGANGTIQSWNSITAFFNMGVQGVDKITREVLQNPGPLMRKAMIGITLPTVMLWLRNQDDPRYQALPQWQKDMYWIFYPTDDGPPMRIGIPFELGILFKTLPERLMGEFFTDNPDAFKGFANTFLHSFTPSITPTAALPFIEIMRNKSSFSGRPIVNQSLQRIGDKQYQYTPYTSEAAKQLGKSVALIPGLSEYDVSSPIVLEHFIRAWTGEAGNFSLFLADKLLEESGVAVKPPKPLQSLADIPFVRSFVIRYPSANTQPIIDFFEKNKINKGRIATVQSLFGREEIDEATRLLADPVTFQKMLVLDSIGGSIGNLSKYIQSIHRNKDMKPYEKRQIIDSNYLLMTELAKTGNDAFREFDRVFEEQLKQREELPGLR